MATCPNKNISEWKDLVKSRGENMAYYLWDKYEGNVPDLYYQEQTEEMPMSRATEATLEKVKAAAQKMGISIQRLADYAKSTGLNTTDINGVADLVRGIIAISEGNEDVALTEEMVHMATAILEQTNPQLVTEMISRIDKFKIYKKTFDQYKNNKEYQMADGKPNVRKIKKEAVDKLIAEIIIRDAQGNTEFPDLLEEVDKSIVRTWWRKILDFIKGLYRKSEISIFEEAAAQIITGEVGGRYYGEVKDGVQDIFNDNPELASIGTPEQYSAYLDSIFPDSQVTDILYHGTRSGGKFNKFDESNLQKYDSGWFGKGFYFTKYFKIAQTYSKMPLREGDIENRYIHRAIINLINPQLVDFELKDSNIKKKFAEEYQDHTTDGAISYKEDKYGDEAGIKRFDTPYTEYRVNSSDQIHILGSEQDVEGFREFIRSSPAAIKGEGVFFQVSEKQKAVQEKLAATDKTLFKEEKKEPVDPMFMDTEEANNWYEVVINGVRRTVKNRVTDRVKAWYKKKFPGKVFTEEEKVFNEFKRTQGIKGHAWFEEIHSRYFNPDGTRKATVDKRPTFTSKVDEDIYIKLEKYYSDLIKRFSQNGKEPLVFSEVKMYDPKRDEAGTIDLLIVEEDGTGHIIDWKFMSAAADSNDVAWYKQGAYNIQLSRYKEILRDNYGIKTFGWNRAIPIIMNIGRKNVKDPMSDVVLKGIAIGTVDTSKIEDLRLMPVSEETETTGNEKLDQLIQRLNAVYKQIGKVDVTSDEEREYKRERLNILKSAIRNIRGFSSVEPLLDVIRILKQDGDRILDDYNTVYKKRPASSKDNQDRNLSDFADNMREYLAIAEAFRDINILIGDIIYKDSMEKTAKTKEQKEELKNAKKLRDLIDKEARAINISYWDIHKISGEFADKFIGQRNLVTGLLNPEAIVRGIAARFRGISELPLASLQILFKIVTNAKARAADTALEEVDKLLEIRKKLAARGGDLKTLVQQLYQKGKDNKIVNKLIRQYDKSFYDQVDNNAQEGKRDKNWLLDNIDVEAYKKESNEILEERIHRITEDYKFNPERVKEMVLQEKRKWDITRKDFNGWNNYVIKRHPLPKWETEEYINLQKDPELFELYTFIRKTNEKAKEVGYISNKLQSTFLPFVRKSMAESLAWDFGLSAVKNFGSSLQLGADDVGYGSINELTGELENSIPKYYTQDFSKAEDGTHDYTDVSEDLFKNMILYINHLEKYKSLSEIEGQLLLVKTVEKFKKHLNTSRLGNVIPGEEPLAGNEENTKMFNDFLRALLYEHKYPLSSFDSALSPGKLLNFVKSAVNTVAGRVVWKPNENPSAISLVKTMDAANTGFQLKTLGFEFISGAVNAFGGNIQVATQAGGYFRAREFAMNELKLIGNRFANNDERKMFIQLVDTFMPLKDDPTYERLKKAGMTELTKHNFSDWIMFFMREPEQHIEKSIFLTLLQNTMVVDGKIVSIREYVKKQYPRTGLSASEFKETNKKIDAEIERLKKTESIDATKKLVDGKLEIPGLDLNNRNELQRLTSLTRRISRNATGGLSDSDLNLMGMNVFTKSMMVFKNWIPKLADTRFSEFRRVSDDFSVTIDDEGHTEGEKYDIGRIRLFFYIMGTSLRDKTSNIYNILSMNEKGMLALDKMYEEFAEKYEKRNGRPLNMTKEDFIDLIRNNLRNEIKELGILLTLFSAMLSLGFMAPDDDDDKASKNFFRYSQRVVNKFTDELLFFYNPAEMNSLLTGSIFPALGIFQDLKRFIKHFTMETTGFDISDPFATEEEVKKKAQPIKYAAKLFPGTKSLLTYMAIFNSEFADEFDITIQKETRRQ